MPSLSLFDNRTLLASNFIVAAVFAVIFFGVTRVFPYVRGMRSIALSYLLVMPACVLLGAQREIPYFVSVIPANLLLMLAIYAMCDGIAQFCDSPRRTKQMAGLIVVALAAITWFTVVTDSIPIRIVLLAFATAIMRSIAAYNLLVRSSVSVNRKVMQMFSLFLALLAVSGLFRALHLVWQGSPRTFLEQSTSVTFMLGLALIYLSFSGCCFLLLASSELIISSRLASERDVVTGVLNRRGLEDRLQVEMDLMEANGQALTVCLLDVDLFKPINDMLGHNAGDEALGSLAQAILKSVRGRDHIGRYGGDEFLVVLPQTSAKEVHVVIDRLRNAISALPVVGGKHKLSVSLGFAEARAGETRSMLIARADAALYLEKSSGRGNRPNRTEDRLERETSEIVSGFA
jgi:diguanylate cyclase (GGDEF)-like protein